jgi:hypothetical protein
MSDYGRIMWDKPDDDGAVRGGWITISPWQHDIVLGVRTMAENELPEWLRRNVCKDYRRTR